MENGQKLYNKYLGINEDDVKNTDDIGILVNWYTDI